MSQQRKDAAPTLDDAADTVLAMAMLWAMPVIGFLLILARL